jgi:hypothetical protein
VDQAKIVIRDIHRYGDGLTVAEAIARLRGGGPVTVTVTDPAPPGGDPRGDPRHGFDITISPAGGTSPRGQPEIAWDGTASCDPAGTALFAEALALAGQLASRTAAPADAAKERTRPPVNENLRQVIHDHMAQIAARHAAALYPHTDGDTAAQLFALLADTALAYQMEVEAELADPGPGQSLAAASGLSAKETLLTGLGENLDLKDDNPGTAPVNGWLAWRAANGEEDPRS